MIRDVLKQRFDKVKSAYEKSRKKNQKVQPQKVEEYENLKRSVEEFGSELLNDIEIFDEQKRDSFDDSIIAVSTTHIVF